MDVRLEKQTFYPIDEVNSDDTESFHNWSSNSHWFVFSSRRDNGLYTYLYIAGVDADGKVTKPFMLPQKGLLNIMTVLYIPSMFLILSVSQLR